jgi:signal transduction histidine kinase
MSFRTRLLLASLATLAVGLGALLIAGNVLLDRRVESEVSSLLEERAQAEVAALAVTPSGVRVRETANDAQLDLRAWVLEGDRVLERASGVSPAVDRAALALGRPGRLAEADAPGELRLRAQPVMRGGRQVATVVVAQSTESLESLQQGVLIGSFVVAALVLLAGFFAIRSALDGALRPVVEMTDAAREWGAHDLERRFALGRPHDELTGLAAMLDGLLARIAASRRHERRFADEVAHELRTPLAALRGRAELALLSGDTEESEEALRAAIEDTDRMAHTIDTLMAAARQELGDDDAVVDATAVAREIDGVELVVDGAIPAAEGDAEVVRRALAPLVENARRHARERVTLAVSADERAVRIAVLDDGPGLDPALAERVFEPGYQGDRGNGAGLGLALARRLARSCGGDVAARAGPGGCFVLSLPRADG